MIPPITHPLGRHWRQPPADSILVDDTHAVMTQAQLEQLAEYNSSFPSGVYVGKMWRRWGAIQRDGRLKEIWWLCWYEYLDETRCKIEAREVLLA